MMPRTERWADMKRRTERWADMKRREFLADLGDAAAWPVVVRRCSERVRRIGVLNPTSADDAVFQDLIGAFQQELALLSGT
jgi:hypothetical protein